MLVAEDEPLIRLGIVVLLEQAGLMVVEAANANEAIRLLERDPEIRVVVTDVDMPGSMDGVKLSHAIRKRWPPVQLIVISGKAGVSENDLPPGAMFFSKPFPEAVLVRTVSAMLP